MYRDTKDISQIILENSALDIYPHILDRYTAEDLFVLCRQTENHRLAFRASWVMEHLCLHDKKLLTKHQNEILDIYGMTDNQSSLRSLSKLVINILKIDSPSLTHQQEENILVATYRCVEDPNCPIALLVNCWDILYLLCQKHIWIKQDLKTCILFHLEKDPSPAALSRGNKILDQLK